jgi:hypothetical protein
MKLDDEEDVTRPEAVTPVFSGTLPVSALPVRTRAQRELFRFDDDDRNAVAAVLDQKHERNGRS